MGKELGTTNDFANGREVHKCRKRGSVNLERK